MVSAQTQWLENLQRADYYNNWIFKQIAPFLGESVLEVGCGCGTFSVLLAEKCSRLIALDLEPEYVAITQGRLLGRVNTEVILADVLELECGETFDAIIMLDVLEHLEDDLRMLKQLKGYLKPQGKLIIKVPALEFLYGDMDRAINHYRRYNKKTLTQKLTAAGFSVVSLWYFNFVGIFAWWFNDRVLKRVTSSSEQVGLFNAGVPIFAAMEAFFKPPVGLSVFAISVRRE